MVEPVHSARCAAATAMNCLHRSHSPFTFHNVIYCRLTLTTGFAEARRLWDSFDVGDTEPTRSLQTANLQAVFARRQLCHRLSLPLFHFLFSETA